MASAYAAVVSIGHQMDHVQLYHARQPIFLEEQLCQLESIKQIVTFLQNYLEDYHQARGGTSQEMNDLESLMTNAACTVEDIIESYIIDDVYHRSMETYNQAKKFGSPFTSQRMISSNDFSQSLQKAIEEMDFIKREVMLIKEKIKVKDHQPRDLASTTSIGAPHIGNAKTMELDDNVVKLMDKLTREQPSLQVIPITGMGGIGKTTLAKNTFDDRLIVTRFDLRGWIAISPNYNMKDLLYSLLLETGSSITEKEKESNEYHQLGQKLRKHLWSRKYLIVLDDMWSIEAWDKLNLFFPDNKNGSRIMITTRLLNVANNFDYSNIYEMKLLDEKESWTLFSKIMFVQEDCPPELEEVGKKIAKSCKGLPLSIVVIAGLLVKSKMTREYWEYVVNDISTIINSDDDDRCLKILSLSYHNLSIHLKPCFLYTGVYPEDHSIHISDLINLWIAEGFIKSHGLKSLEEVAEDYLKDLIERNLIVISKFGSTGNMKYCKIHDLLRDLCLREAQKERLFYTMKLNSRNYPLNMNNERRIVVMSPVPPMEIDNEQIISLQSAEFIRSFSCHFVEGMSIDPKSIGFRLVRVLRSPSSSIRIFPCHMDEIRRILNLWYVNCNSSPCGFSNFLPWNLQIVSFIHYFCKQFDIWKMQQLRHVNILRGVTLSNPPCCKIVDDIIVLENLQTLADVNWFRCTEEVVKRIPNIKKLKIRYPSYKIRKDISDYCLNNLGYLHKLQSLSCDFEHFQDLATQSSVRNLNFPDSLKKLSLKYCNLDGEGITTKIGSLSHLEKLVLNSCYIGKEWNTVEGQFISLKCLEIIDDYILIEWRTDSTHFPCLERLILRSTYRLKEIPVGIGEIETLKVIKLFYCPESVINSAVKIIEEQQSLGNEDLHLECSSRFPF